MERTSTLHRTVLASTTGLLVLLLPLAVFPQSEKKTPAQNTQIVLLGTGTPSPDPERSGPATAVVVNGTPYLIDFGPGVVRRIAAASLQGVKGLAVTNVRVAFLGFSLDRLVRFLVLLGSDVEIVVKPRTRATSRARVLVA